MSNLKERKRIRIIEAATSLFLEKTISGVTMSDVATRADMGDATIFRYFSKKASLVLAVAIKLSDEVLAQNFMKENTATGYEDIVNFYHMYLDVFKNNENYYNFIHHLDGYMISNHLVSNRYQETINHYKKLFLKAYERGLLDQSVKRIDNIEIFYHATTLSLLNLCMKLAVSPPVIESDTKNPKELEIEMIINIFLSQLKNN